MKWFVRNTWWLVPCLLCTVPHILHNASDSTAATSQLSMMACYVLPFIADQRNLPAPLPTLDDIESAVEILSDTTGRKVVGVNIYFVVKYGMQVDPIEGETMIFLAQSTQVPVPQVYALFQNPTKDTTYIVMERIKGSSLDQEWSRMSPEWKKAISIQLRDIVGDMRKLKSPGGYCSIGHRGLPDGVFWTDDASNPFAGPFDTESELNKALVSKYKQNGLSKYKANYYSRTFASLLQGHEPTFSHADLQRKNIIIRNSPATELRETKWEVAHPELVIIDWEFAGWYPSYWEYARAIFACGRWEDDWSDWLDDILDPFRNEYAWMEIVVRELWS